MSSTVIVVDILVGFEIVHIHRDRRFERTLYAPERRLRALCTRKRELLLVAASLTCIPSSLSCPPKSLVDQSFWQAAYQAGSLPLLLFMLFPNALSPFTRPCCLSESVSLPSLLLYAFFYLLFVREGRPIEKVSIFAEKRRSKRRFFSARVSHPTKKREIPHTRVYFFNNVSGQNVSSLSLSLFFRVCCFFFPFLRLSFPRGPLACQKGRTPGERERAERETERFFLPRLCPTTNLL